MSKEIVPFKLLVSLQTVDAKWSSYCEAQASAKLSTKEKLNNLLNEDGYFGVDLSLLMLGTLTFFGFMALGISKNNIPLFLVPFSSYTVIAWATAPKLKKIIYGKKILLELAENEVETKAKLADPLNQEAVALKTDIVSLNSLLHAFNELLIRLDDFRPLTDEEIALYQALTKRRQDLGLRILSFEERLRLAPQITTTDETLTLTAVPTVDRADLEKQMEEKRKMIEATTAEYEKLKQEHTALYPRVMG